MPRFDPFIGLRYARADLSQVICPPYDVISAEQRAALEASHPANCVRVELPVGGDERYEAAAKVLKVWRTAGGVMTVDREPSFYVYRMSFVDESGAERHTTGVLGALGLEPPGTGILPHERTTPKDKADRLDLLRATRTNLSPIWGLSMAAGLSAAWASVVAGEPDATAVEGAVEGPGGGIVSHALWRVSSSSVVDAVSAAVASAPVVVADGHHRFEVALAYQAEVGAGGPQDAVLAFVVELSPSELAVAPIHRLLSGDVSASSFEPWFEVSPCDAVDGSIGARMEAAGALCLVTSGGAWLLRPRAVLAAAPMDLDSSRLAVALEGLPGVEVRYQHGWENVVAAVSSGAASAGVLLRPATVAQISLVASARERMPPKTTFFTPKPATGMAFRGLDDQVR